MKKLFLFLTIGIFILAFAGGCAGNNNSSSTASSTSSNSSTGSNSSAENDTNATQEINVSAAASLKDVFQELKTVYTKDHPDVKINFNFASSGTLQHQIEQGAPVDLFISAGKKQTDALFKKDLLEKPQLVTGNTLVLVTPKAKGKTITDLKELLNSEYSKIALGTPETVPAGKYAEEALEKTGVLKGVTPKLVFAKDVRQVLAYVETGNADAGFVYHSDAISSDKVTMSLTIPENLHKAITYPAALTKNAQNRAETEKFLQFLKSDSAKKVFHQYGFSDVK